MEYKLKFQTPATKFSEALPLGNGSFGAMVYGNYPEYRFSLNADTLWSGKPFEEDSVTVPQESIDKVRKLLEEDRNYEAEQVVQKEMTGQKYNESYVSAGFLTMRFSGEEEQREIFRELDLTTGCAKTEIRKNNSSILAESFLSGKDNVLVTSVSGKEPFSVTIGMSSLLNHQVSLEDGILLTGEAPSHVEPNYVECDNGVFYGGGMPFVIWTKAITNGIETKGEGTLEIKEATRLILYTAIQTGYLGYRKSLEKDKKKLRSGCEEILGAAMEKDWEILKKRQIESYREMFGRVDVSLGEQNRIYELLFQYGRYLLMASSAPVSKESQPANLQGIWCEDVRSVWSSNWTININTEMNYWLAGPGALSDCEEPLIHMVEEVASSGERTARETFGCRGFAACHNIDLWRQTTPVKGQAKWSYWPMGGVWLATHLYRHYLFTMDRTFLRNQAYPVLRNAALFCLDWMYEEEGGFHSAPSTSPENTFLDKEGRECCIADSSTMDMALIREILEETIEAAKQLQEDDPLVSRMKEALSKLLEYKVGNYGQLMEWSKDYQEFDKNHRHFAHLVGFHPFHQIDSDTRPDLLGAVETVLKRRTEGVRHYIGWNEAWLVNFYARLKNGEEAKRHLDLFLEHCAYPNLFSLHPPLGESAGEREIFQIDGNFGVAAGIAEMLLQSKPGMLRLLPALPKEWKEGRIVGLKAEGGHSVELAWKDGRLSFGRVHAKSGGVCVLEADTPIAVANHGKEVGRARRMQDVYRVKVTFAVGESYRIIGIEGEMETCTE